MCAWDVCYVILCHSLYIHSGNTGNLFSLVSCSLWWAQIVGYVVACRSYSFCLYITPFHSHHCANFIRRHWTYQMPVRYNLSSVWVMLSIFSQLSIIQYVGLCVFSLPISFVMVERIYILCLIIIIKSQVLTITQCLGLGHETMVCAVCLSIFLFLSFYIHDIQCDVIIQPYPNFSVAFNHLWSWSLWVNKCTLWFNEDIITHPCP